MRERFWTNDELISAGITVQRLAATFEFIGHAPSAAISISTSSAGPIPLMRARAMELRAKSQAAHIFDGGRLEYRRAAIEIERLIGEIEEAEKRGRGCEKQNMGALKVGDQEDDAVDNFEDGDRVVLLATGEEFDVYHIGRFGDLYVSNERTAGVEMIVKPSEVAKSKIGG